MHQREFGGDSDDLGEFVALSIGEMRFRLEERVLTGFKGRFSILWSNAVGQVIGCPPEGITGLIQFLIDQAHDVASVGYNVGLRHETTD